MSIQKVCKALYSSEGNDFGLRKETHGFLLTASNSVLPAAFLSLSLALMKGDFDEPSEWPIQREGCRETPLSGRCSPESVSALSLTHILEKHHGLWTRSPQGPDLLARVSFFGFRSLEKQPWEGKPAPTFCRHVSPVPPRPGMPKSKFLPFFRYCLNFFKGVSNLSYVLPPLLGFMIQFPFYYMILAGSPR